MHADAVAELADELAVVAVDSGDVDGNVLGLRRVRARAEEGGDERELVMLALEVRAGAGLEGLEDGLEAEDVLSHSGAGWRGPGGRVAALVVAFDLSTETEHEAPAGVALEVPCDLGGDKRAAGERDSDAGAEAELLGVFGDDHEWEEGVVAGFRRDHGVIAGILDAAGGVTHSFDGGCDEGGFDFHVGAPFRVGTAE